ncbi:hypothetical protein HPB50_021937 [Hyalomma asiaticum]|uniref:Uncharacterized protein n=1 Tax=Hyalomma asiaticum TaxID=266040 RepID=A0ACB7SGA0_HYAAI|nr:hypothetical protein HPB50_021937 [Hyalomma asiaticum]
MHALNTRDIRTGFLSSQAPHTCNASAQEEGGRQRPTRTTRHTHAHRPDIPHDTRTELLAAAPPPSSQPAPPTPTQPTPPPVQASAHKDSPSYNLPGAAAPVHSSGLEKTAVECVTLRISLFLIVPIVLTRAHVATTSTSGNGGISEPLLVVTMCPSHASDQIARPIRTDRGRLRPPECTSATRERADQTVPQ